MILFLFPLIIHLWCCYFFCADVMAMDKSFWLLLENQKGCLQWESSDKVLVTIQWIPQRIITSHHAWCNLFQIAFKSLGDRVNDIVTTQEMCKSRITCSFTLNNVKITWKLWSMLRLFWLHSDKNRGSDRFISYI